MDFRIQVYVGYFVVVAGALLAFALINGKQRQKDPHSNPSFPTWRFKWYRFGLAIGFFLVGFFVISDALTL